MNTTDKKYALDSTVPRAGKLLNYILKPIDRFFDWAYHSSTNPLYRSGTLATGLLLVALVTGIYLLFFYRVSAPYESMLVIQDQWYLGRWIRALHRYSSDAAVIATGFHALRMMIEGKTWGARALAWISGLVLLFILLFTGWSGYVMVWDMHGLELARAGARMVDALNILPEPLSRTFSGALPASSTFFFMNLFMHVAFPLAIVFILWLHTSRLTHSKWILNPRLLWIVIAALTLASLIWPAILAGPPDALNTAPAYPLDLFFTGWLPWADLPVGWQWSFWIISSILLVSMPWWWKGKKANKADFAFNDIHLCGGCNQCVEDCPFEAIEMIPRPEGKGKAEHPEKGDLVALVNNDHCVSCGLCIASCSHLSIYPADRNPRQDLTQLAGLSGDHEASSIVFIYCHYNDLGPDLVSHLETMSGRPIIPWPVECLGSLHHSIVESFLRKFTGVFSLGCPPSMCRSRLGSKLYEQRIFEQRPPADGRNVGERTGLTELKPPEKNDALRDFAAFLKKLGLESQVPVPAASNVWLQRLRGTLVSMLLLCALAALSAIEVKPIKEMDAQLRLTWRLPGQKVKICKDVTKEELAKQLAHMRHAQDCKVKYLGYDLEVKVDGIIMHKERIYPFGARGDRPLAVARDLAMPEGLHRVELSFIPEASDNKEAVALSGSFEEIFVANRAVLVTRTDKNSLRHRTQAVLTADFEQGL